ncbi:MAG: hypothetical protein IPH29_14335 [Candidatus Microthrix sp.]|uniref:Uncharacterized protein n=1 Tax=Candidatus Neomicrothrix subdominans TaxID=2954438 RepID=A0A936NBN5_9ACTN|nr:hypothetical protein [Candidatus Microthrix sp.]MBK9297332.1 hypothetical protein [Candidatus Microthrix subdominans]
MLNDDNIDNCRSGVLRMQPIFAEPKPDREPYTEFFSTLLGVPDVVPARFTALGALAETHATLDREHPGT